MSRNIASTFGFVGCLQEPKRVWTLLPSFLLKHKKSEEYRNLRTLQSLQISLAWYTTGIVIGFMIRHSAAYTIILLISLFASDISLSTIAPMSDYMWTSIACTCLTLKKWVGTATMLGGWPIIGWERVHPLRVLLGRYRGPVTTYTSSHSCTQQHFESHMKPIKLASLYL